MANGGERLALAAANYDNVIVNGVPSVAKLNVVVSEVTYGDGGKWGNWSDGLGAASTSSIPTRPSVIRRTKPTATLRARASGRPSNRTARPVKHSVPPPTTTSPCCRARGNFSSMKSGVRVDHGPNLVDHGSIESGLTGWTLQGSHDFSII